MNSSNESTTRPAPVIHQRFRHLVLALVVSPILLSQVGCVWYTWRNFNPAEEEMPIVMFGQYELSIFGNASRPHNISCGVEFVEDITDTMSINTIPVFVIDSFCIVGDCLSIRVCPRPNPGYRVFSDSAQAERGYREYPTSSVDVTEDLSWNGKRILPADYFVSMAGPLPEACKDRDVSVLIHARLLDRVTGELVARESKKVQFYIKKVTRPQILS